MIKLLFVALALIAINEASISNLQLLVPDDAYAILASGKLSPSSSRGSIALSNAITDDENASNAEEEEVEEIEETDSEPVSAPPSTAAPAPAPAAITRVRPSISVGAISTTGISRPSLLISSLASSSSSASAIPSALAKTSATIQHRILPAESIPLPITISTRPGLRTVIAPETITIQQPTIAKVGEVVQQIPTAVSHQRQTVVHKHARVVTPIVAPAVRTVTSQIVRAYHTPLVYAPQQPTIQVINN